MGTPVVETRKTLYILAAIIVAFVVQTALNPTIRVVQDEPWVSIPAYTLVTEGTLSLDPINKDNLPEAWPPFLQICLAAVYRVFGFGVVQGRFLMVFFGALSVLLAFLVGRDLFDAATGLLASAFLAVDNLFFLASRTVRPEILVVTLILLACYLGIRAVQTERRVLFVFSGVAGAAAMSTHPHGFIGVVALGFLYVFEYRSAVLRKPGLWLYVAGVFVGSLPYAFYIVLVDLPNRFGAFRSQVLAVGPGASRSQWLLESLRTEAGRYQRFILAPYRIQIGVIALVAVVLGLVSRNRRHRFLSSVILTHLVLFVLLMTVQKNVRYMVLISPYLAMLVASLVMIILRVRLPEILPGVKPSVLSGRTTRVALVSALLVLWGGTQFVGNMAYYWQFKDSRYYEFTDSIERLLPADAGVYTIVTFWFAFHNRPFYSYNRVDFSAIRDRYRPSILLLDDSFMVNGTQGEQTWSGLRKELQDYVARRGRLLGTVRNSFYGDVKVYEVSYD